MTEKTEDKTKEAQPSHDELLAKMEEARKRLEEATRKNQEILLRIEEEKSNAMIGGSAEAGAPPVEESARDYALRMIRGG